ncbi:cubilin-like isoform X2 [Asterias amurensis]|uniref:cubilin-like isoform X2 n=1 Tax=Asterias amurensis TaxID=7602 RepID=UPI003AB2DA38
MVFRVKMANGWLRTAWGRSLALCLWTMLLMSTLAVVDGGARKKRQSSGAADDVSNQPKMVTDQGHLTFQTGDNHNITFKTSGSGRVVMGDYDLLAVVDMVKDNAAAIKDLNNGETPDNVQQQLDQINADLTALQSRVTALEGTGSGNLDTRVATLEQQVQTLTNNLNLNECQTNPCQHGGTCVNLYQGYQCRCVPGWTGTTCSDDVNECATISGTEDDCQNSGTCVNTLGSFRCSCPANWFGPQCTIRYDDCSTASHTDLCGHGFCVNDPRVITGTPKYSCVCMDGWQTDGTSNNPACTIDIDECNDRDYPCSSDPLVQCINVPGTYYCGNCPTGYTGNGNQCTDIDECLSNNGGCSVSPLVQCINNAGSRQCGSCPVGYVGDGVTCIFVGICNQDNGGCSSFATCTENSGVPDGRICTCNQGYTGDGVGASGCIPSSGASCLDNPCINGRCEIYGNSYQCICNAGWTGDQCGQDVDECASAPCQNGGTCHNLVNGFDCDCLSGFSGDQCEESQQSCGGYLNGETGFFEFPPYGQVYDHGLSCAWVITVQDSKVVYISFTRFKLESHANCDYDFLQINDGASASAYTLGRFCGEDVPDPITSTHNQLYFWFRSDGSVSYEGFGINWSSVDPECGEDLIGSNYGSINSPGYPGNYPVNRDCVWTVTVDAGMYMTFAFGTLQLETHETCDYDYVEIRDGLTETAVSLGKFCSTLTPAPVQTTGPYAFIRFHSDESLTDTGFHITYTSMSIDPGCGGVLTDDDAILISPNYPNPYNHNAECIWTIQIGAGAQIKFTITDLTIEEEANCNFDYVELRDGFDETAPFVGRYCHADAIPPPFVSSSNMLWVKFASDSSINAGGFRATYELNCGGIFTDPTQELLSPYFPNYYPHDKICEYVINAPQGQMVIVTFITFDIEAHEECNFDYLQLHDGGDENSLIISKLCGTALPAEVSSTGNSMYLKFVTDGSIANYGFRATFRFEDAAPGCGGQFTDDVGIFASPPHPEGYPHGVHCVYSIMVTDGYVIRLTFNSFSLEEATDCIFDYVQVYDNSTNALSPDMGRYCGSSPPPILTTTGNMMTVIFHTDSSIAREGFTASYVALDATTVCGGELNQDTGVITSPNYPDEYPHNRQCTWVISASSGRQINVNFTDFDMEQHVDCLYDYVELRNGGYETSPLLGTFCGSSLNPTSYTSHSNKMFVKFVSDSSFAARGFSLSFDGTATGCGGELTTPTGSFVSPNYPYPYGHDAECFWLITTNQGSTLFLTFADFDLETHGTCAFDFLKVFDGLTENDAELGTFCGTDFPAPVQSTGNSLRVKFRTDYSMAGRGFHAAYQTNCDHVRLTGYSGVIESPNFPDAYPHSRDCTWIIETTEGNTVNLTFTTLTLEDHVSCSYDYIEIRDGQEDDSPLIGDRLCGQNVQPNGVFFTSTDRYLLIRFVSDSSIADAGFQASYVVNGCGGELTENTGSLSSPNYPNPYDHSRVCTWTITVDYGHSITLTITDFDVEASNDCQYDALNVYSGRDDSGLQLVSLCHSLSSPQTISTTGRYMYVYFRTDSSISGRGFSATYQSQDGGCGGNYSTPTGDFHSPNYPNVYPHNTDCTWLITVADEHRVQLKFLDFDLEGASCVYDYVKLFDGPSLDYPLLLTHCGTGLPVPAVVYSSGNQMFIRMLSDSSVAYTGFHATYETACGGRLDATQTGVLKTTNYPGAYPANQNCTWVIESPNPGDRVTLSFSNMDIEQSTTGCEHDYITLYEGNDDSAPVIDQYCGTSIPAPITSFGSALTVSFVSDSSLQLTGFRAVYSTSLSVCGADFTAQSGAFASPGYPASYPGDTECVWTIQSSPGNQVQVSFSAFNLEVDCNLDYLEARVGDENGALIGRYCGPRRPSNLTATGTMWLKFVSDPSGTGTGFLANFGLVFGGDLIAPTGQISSPLYPNNYLNNMDVMWTIYVSTNRRVRIRFIEFSVEPSSTECGFDAFEVYDGADSSSPILLTDCGVDLPDAVESSGSVATVLFRTDSSVTYPGFLVEWTEVSGVLTVVPPTLPPGQCGANLLAGENAQMFSSPNFPNGYASDLDCQWLVEADPGKTVKLQLSDINIEAHTSCLYDYVELYNGDTIDTATSLGRFCGRVEPDPSPLYSTSNMMLAVFHSDGSINGTGFQATYQTFCGGYISSSLGVITSPLYPGTYTNNRDCTWVIEAPSGFTITVNFLSDFNIQTSTNCVNDYVQVLNGGDLTSPPLGSSATGRYCGSAAPAAMETSGNMLTVRFRTDNSGGARGFSLSYLAQQQGCGGQVTLTDAISSSDIMSPNYPSNYPPSIECIWVVTAPSGEAIQMNFASPFYIEPHASCDFDYLQVLDGGDQNSNELGKLCGTTVPDTITTSGNAAVLRFRTDSSLVHPGFKVTASIATCGGTISGTSGVITSPSYPSNYDSNLDCMWTVRAPDGHYITFSFDTNFNVVNSAAADCSSGDVLRVNDGRNSSAFELARACGSVAPPDFDTSSNYALVHFTTDASQVGTGFSLSFQSSQEVCGGDLATATGSFTSPNYPQLYAHSRVCEWRITVASGQAVTLTFDDFELEGNADSCIFDYIEVFNGLADDSPSLGRFCGNVAPQGIASTSNTMRVVFTTDGSVAFGGFSARYDSQDQAQCGAVINISPGSQGTFSSIGYGSLNYTNNLNCQWILSNSALTNSSLYLSFDAGFDLEAGFNCQYDAVGVFAGIDSTADPVGVYCGTTAPDPIVMPQSSAFVRFLTDSNTIGGGFKITYSASSCGGIVSGSSGVITSPNFPQNYDHDDHCAWLIQAPTGTTVTLTFTSFDVETHPKCQYDYLSVRNGGTFESPQISGESPWCGSTAPAAITTSSNEVLMVFMTDRSESAGGFRLEWSTDARGCGGTFHGNTGTFKSNNYPSAYGANEECVWVLMAEMGYHIRVDFDASFNVQSGDSIQVNDGSSSNDTLIGTYSGTTAPATIVSSLNIIRIRFRSDASNQGTGFQASWSIGCGATFTGVTTGRIVSPGYPGRNYEDGLTCEYIINWTPMQSLGLLFSDPFGIEVSSDCSYDGLRIWAGTDDTGTRISSICGDQLPESILVMGPVFMRFYSDSSINDVGFGLDFEPGCGGTFTNPSGVIQTPTHLDSYRHSQNCSWIITVSDDRSVSLKFSSMDIEPHSSCIYDYIEIYDGADSNSPMLAQRLCGTTPPTDAIISSGSSMLVRFVSDFSVSGDGFVAAYQEVIGPSLGCGGILNAPRGTITSVDVNSDGNYEDNLNCMWFISAEINKVIELTFTGTFNIEDSAGTCPFDFLEIHDGYGSVSPLVGVFCGQTPPAVITLSSNQAYLLFVTDSSINQGGFTLNYASVDPICGGTFNATDVAQVITSPNYPNVYPHNTRCTWYIDAPDDTKHVRIEVNAFDIENEGNCNYDYLEFRDFPETNGQTLRYCGTNVPPVFDTAGRTAKIYFMTDVSSSGTGFSLTYAIANCSKDYTGDNGRVTSPGYPLYYHDIHDCKITITAPSGTFLALYFTEFNVEFSTDCVYDKLDVYDGVDDSTPVLYSLCGVYLPDPIFLSANTAYLNFVTDTSVTFAGFDLTYTSSTVSLGCGGAVGGRTGSFTSPAHPFAYGTNLDCGWSIEVPTGGNQLTLDFTTLAIDGDEGVCNQDYLEVYDGSSSAGRLIGRYCGMTPPAQITASFRQLFVRLVTDGQNPPLGNTTLSGFRAVFNS